MVRKLQQTTKFTEEENAAVLDVLHKLKKKYGYSYHDLARMSELSIGGLIGLRKNTRISPNIATKLAVAFGYENWQDMLEDFEKKERRKAKPVVSQDWKGQIEARVAELEKQIAKLSKTK